MKNIKKILVGFWTAVLLIPLAVWASPVNVNRLNNDHIEPLKNTDFIKAPYFTATSTTATSTFNGNFEITGLGHTNKPLPHSSLSGDIFQKIEPTKVYPHSIIKANGKVFIPTQNYGFGKVIVFNDPDGVLTNYTVLDLYNNGGTSSGFYDSGTGLIYLTNYYGAKGNISTLDPVTNAQAEFFSGSTLDLGGAPSIASDGTYIYGVTYGTTPTKFFKIRLSDGALIASTTWTSATYGHSVVMKDDLTEFYAGSAGGRIAKVSTSAMTYTDVDIGELGITDDMVYKSGFLYAATEITSPYHIIKLNVSTMTFTLTECPLSYGLFTDGTDLYNMGGQGYLSKYPAFDLTNEYRYSFSGSPAINEMVVTDGGRYLFTNYTDGSIYWFGLSPVSLSLGYVSDDSTFNADSIYSNRLNSGAVFTDGLKVGTGHTSMRGLLDIYSQNTATIADVTTSDSTIHPTYGSGYAVSSGYTWTYSVYAYKTVYGTKIYSENPSVFTFTDDGSTDQMNFTFSWNAVSDADGYRVIATQDDYYGSYDDNYTDIPSSFTSAIYYKDGDSGYETNSATYYTYESPVTVTPISTMYGPNSYIDTITGKWIHTGDFYVSGNMGVGVTSPTQSLDVSGKIHFGSTNNGFIMDANNGETMTFQSGYVSATAGSAVQFINYAGTQTVSFGGRVAGDSRPGSFIGSNSSSLAVRIEDNAGNLNRLLASAISLKTGTGDLIPSSGVGIRFDNSRDIEFGTSAGTKIGIATSSKFAFWNATPIVQPVATTDLITGLVNAGLRASGTAVPLTTTGQVSLSNASTTNLTVSTQATLASTTMTAPLRLKGYTVAGLPACTQGDTAFVTDATLPTYLAALTGGGAVVTPVFCKTTNSWVSY